MKKYLLPLLVFTLLIVTVIPAAAAPELGSRGPKDPQGQQGSRGIFALTGTIAAIDVANNTVTISVYRGNKLSQPYLGTSVTVVTTSKTRFLFKSGTTTTAKTITFADLRVGNPVSVNGTLANNIWTTTRITVGASLSCLP